MGHLELALLGPLQIRRDGEQVTGLRSNKARALLAYLVVEASHPHHREALAELLWPDQPERDARRRLRYALSDLRQAVEDGAGASFFLSSRDSLQFDFDTDPTLDIAAFEQHLVLARLATGRASPDRASAIRHLEAAVDLWRGEFLEGLYVDSASYEQWLVQQRERLHWLRMGALSHLAALHEDRDDFEAAQHCARNMLELEPWHEGAHQQLMRVLALDGRRSEAMAQYQICLRQLAEEFGATPSEETTALYRAIYDGRVTARPREGGTQFRTFPVPAFLVTCPARFVAREAELARLQAFLEEALSGNGQVAFIMGEAGSGKTALMAEFSRLAMEREDQIVAVGGTCTSYVDQGQPFLPFREILQLLTGSVHLDEDADALAEHFAERLRRLKGVAPRIVREAGPDLPGRLLPSALPDLRAGGGHPLRQPPLAQAAARQGYPNSLSQSELFEQITSVLQELSKENALILCLDDLHWADDSTLSLLFHVGSRLQGCQILILGTFRPSIVALGRPLAAGGGTRHPLEELIHEFGRVFGDIVIDLKQADRRHFVDAYLDTEENCLSTQFRQTLFEHTSGNPLFTIELLRGMQERGDLVRNEAGQWMEGPSFHWDHLPPKVEAVVAARLGRLPPTLRSTLEAATVLGDRFGAEVVACMLGVPKLEVIQQLSGPLSQQHHLVCADGIHRLEPGGQRLSRYRFCHRLFRTYVYHHLDEVRVAHLHEAAGCALEDLYGDQVSEITEELARHFEAARLVEKAASYLLEAGKRFARLSAHPEAIALYERGLSLTNGLSRSEERNHLQAELESARQRSLAALQA